jgi:hypothetical protein
MTLRNAPGKLHLVEEVIYEIVATLKANLPAKLSELEGQYGDGLDLPAPIPECYYTPTNEGPSPLNIAYPSVFIVGGRASNPPLTEGMHGQGFGGDMTLAYNVAVFVLCKGETEVILQKYLYRYSLAVVEVLVQNDSLGIGECFLESIEYESPQISSEDELIRDVPIQFIVMTNESY